MKKPPEDFAFAAGGLVYGYVIGLGANVLYIIKKT